MKAIIHDDYGPPESLELRDVPDPTIEDGEVLVRIVAASLHRGDVFVLRGTPAPARLATGLLHPKYGVPGFGFAGVVEAIGSEVKGFAVGDEVFGECNGSCAELAVTDPTRITRKPESMRFDQAAAMTTSALAALHGLRDVAGLEAGQSVLINGASGGVGHFAVQIAKVLGAEVTGVCSAASIDMVRSLGADHVIDYRSDDFTRGQTRYDVIFDNVENHELADVRGVLAPEGVLLLNSGTQGRGLELYVRLIKPLVVSPFVKQRLVRFLSAAKHEDLQYLAELFEAGKVRPVIEQPYALAQTAEALTHLEQSHVHGKLVVRI